MNKNIASDEIIYWTPYNRSEIICGRFNINEWHLVVFDVDSDTSFANAIEASDNIKVYILKRHIDDKSIAFLYTKIENKKKSIVSIHGGGWGKSMYLSLLYYRGVIIMIENLISKGYMVRTTCLYSNHKAYKFLHSIGFVKYKTSHNQFYMWINLKRLHNSNIYQFLNR